MAYLLLVLSFAAGAAVTFGLSARVSPPPAQVVVAFAAGWLASLLLTGLCAIAVREDYQAELCLARHEAERYQEEAEELRRILGDLRELHKMN